MSIATDTMVKELHERVKTLERIVETLQKRLDAVIYPKQRQDKDKREWRAPTI